MDDSLQLVDIYQIKQRLMILVISLCFGRTKFLRLVHAVFFQFFTQGSAVDAEED